MRSILAFSFVLVALTSSSFAKEKTFKPTLNVQESSRPVFDPKMFEDKIETLDEFLNKIRQKNNEFQAKQNSKKVKFFQKLSKKHLTNEEAQKKIAKFHSKQKMKALEYQREQQKKIEKYYQKQNKDAQGSKLSKLDKKQNEFIAEQTDERRKFFKKLNRQVDDYETFQEKVQKFDKKQLEKRERFFAKLNEKRQKQLEKEQR